jgi:phosphoglucosamine mutase
MENMEELLSNAFDDISEINTIDGVRLTFNDGSWVLVRPSGTEDYVRITLEAKTEEKAEYIKDTCTKIIKENI